MTNLHLAILSTVLTLAILTFNYLVWRSLVKGALGMFQDAMGHITGVERSLRSHVVDEINHLEGHVAHRAADVLDGLACTEETIVSFVRENTSDLRKHAEDLRNHAKELSDRAEVQASSPRQAVTRPSSVPLI